MATVDLTVMGAGVFGLSCAFAAARRGARVRVIDPAGPAAGASGGIVGALAPHVPETWNAKKAFQRDSLLMSGPFWAAVEEVGGRATGYARTGRLQPLPDDRAVALARERARGAEALWLGQAEWQVTEEVAGDWHPPSATGLWVRDTLTARIHPRQATLALAAAVTALGGEVVEQGLAEGAVLWATGHADLAEMSARHGRLVGAGIKGQAALLDHDARDAPQLFVDGVHIVPHADGTTAIGSTTERAWEVEGTDRQLESLIAQAREAVPALRSAPVLARWAGIRPRARTRAPMLGHHPFREGQFIANGGFKIGFGMAPKVAEVMAQLILEGTDTIPDDFRAEASL